MIDDPQTLDEKMQNIQELVHQYLPGLPVVWFRGTRTLGECRIKKDENGKLVAYQIRISSLMASANSWDTIRLVVLHEIAHGLVPGSGHNDVWKAICEQIGARPERYASITDRAIPGFEHYVVKPRKPKKPSDKPQKKRNFSSKTPSVYKYLSVCEKCGELEDYYSKKISTNSIHAGCGGNLVLVPNPLFGIENYNADRLFAELKEKIVPVLSSNENTLGIARPEFVAKPKDKSDFLYVLCKKAPSEDERKVTYKKLEGLYEHYQLSDKSYDGSGVMDRITVKLYHHVLHLFYVTRAELWKFFSETFERETGPEIHDFTLKSIENAAYPEVLTETDGCWKKLAEKANACPKYVFKKWCKHELEQATECSEGYGYDLRYKSPTQHLAFTHLMAALFYLNQKQYTGIAFYKKPEEFDFLEKKPAEFGERYLKALDLQFKRGYGSVIEKELNKLIKETRELLKDM